MMRENDVIVIGGGLAGLIAAAVAAKRGKKVTVMTKGAGMLAIGSGTIDILGYNDRAEPVLNPKLGLGALPGHHPYAKIGIQGIADAVSFFLTLCKEEGYGYTGDLEHTLWLPTVAGTLKPSCLVPETMNPAALKTARHVTVVGFFGLKDYHPELIIKGLQKINGYQKQYEAVMIEPGCDHGRDLTALDLARWLETEAGQAICREQMQKRIPPGSVALIPPVLGTRPDYRVRDQLERAAGCRLIETVGLPPAVTGFRLRSMLVNYLKKQAVSIIEQASVARAVIDHGRCVAVVTENVDRERRYNAHAFILATGGFLGGGLLSGPGYVREPIFHLPVTAPADQEQWGNLCLFSKAKQPFALIGINVNGKMCPLDPDGRVVLPNVHVVGRSLAGYDYAFEKSGNGVAIASGYQAGILV